MFCVLYFIIIIATIIEFAPEQIAPASIWSSTSFNSIFLEEVKASLVPVSSCTVAWEDKKGSGGRMGRKPEWIIT